MVEERTDPHLPYFKSLHPIVFVGLFKFSGHFSGNVSSQYSRQPPLVRCRPQEDGKMPAG